MESVNRQAYNSMLSTGHILAQDIHGPKALEMPDGLIVKFFRSKRLLSSARFKPYAYRFRDHAAHLTRLGLKTVKVIRIQYYPERRLHLVWYPKLPGSTLRDTLNDYHGEISNIEKFSTLLARLHEHGIYFRSLHFGNIIILPDNTLALIDVSDMKISKKPLGLSRRTRNFKHFLRYDADRTSLLDFGMNRFLQAYLELTSLSPSRKKTLVKRINRLI